MKNSKNRKTASNMIAQMARQSLRSSRMRNNFVLITIVLASALLMAILMFAMGQKQQVKEELSHRQQVSYYNLTEAQLAALAKDDRISCQIQMKTGVLSEMDGFSVMPCYVSELSDDIRVAELESGRLPETEDEIAAQAALLRNMGVSPTPGSTVTFSFYDGTTETFTLSGILKGGETAKQFSVLLSKDYAEKGSQLKDIPYEVYAKLYNATHLLAEECREAMYLIGSDAGIERKYVAPSKAFLDTLSPDFQSMMLYGLVGAAILLACILVIYGVFYLSVIGRIHQFGQLRTIGMTRRQIARFVSREGSLLFLRSAPVGMLIGGTAGYCMVPAGFSLANTFLAVLLVFAVIYVITMISVRKPARLAGAVSPMEALRYLPQDEMPRRKKSGNPAAPRKLCRRLTPFALGRMNFSRNRKKAAVTMLSLGMGGILFMTAATYLSSFNRANYARQGFFTEAEFHIQYAFSAITLSEHGLSGLQAQAPLGEETTARIASLEGVKKITEVKSFGVRYDYPKQDNYNDNDQILLLTEEETKEIGAYLEDGSVDYGKLTSGDYILVAGNDTVEEIYGWKFALGDTITLHYFDGTDAAQKDVTILGILNQQYVLDNKVLEGWFLMPEQAVLNLVSFDSLTSDLLVSTEPAQEEAIGDVLAELVAERSELSLETLAERNVAYAQNVDQLFGAISGLSIFIMTFSLLSMMNTLITNIVTRKQELAMLESIGMGKGQIRGMLLGESLLLVLATVGVTMTAGTLCGFWLSSLLYQNGAFYMAFRFPTAFALTYAGVLIGVPLLIVFVSLRGFSKEALVERLRGAEA